MEIVRKVEGQAEGLDGLSDPARALLGVRADQGRCGAALFEVLDDGERLRQVAPVVELEHRQLAERIARQVLGRLLLALQQIDADLLQRQLASGERLLGEIEPDLGRIRSNGKEVELHAGESSPSVG